MSQEKHFAICVRNDEYDGTLELRKIYEVIDDPSASRRSYLRIIDESGEDYLYPSSWFVRLELPETVEQLLHDLAAR